MPRKFQTELRLRPGSSDGINKANLNRSRVNIEEKNNVITCMGSPVWVGVFEKKSAKIGLFKIKLKGFCFEAETFALEK